MLMSWSSTTKHLILLLVYVWVKNEMCFDGAVVISTRETRAGTITMWLQLSGFYVNDENGSQNLPFQ